MKDKVEPHNQGNYLETFSNTPLTDSAIDRPNDYDQTEKFSNQELEVKKNFAVQFVATFHIYSADKP